MPCRRRMQVFLKTGFVVGVLTAMIWGSVWLVMLEKRGGGGPLMDAAIETVSKYIDLTPIGLSPGRSPRDATQEEQDDFQDTKKGAAQKVAERKGKEEKTEISDEEKRKRYDERLAEQTRKLEEQWLEEQRNKEKARIAEQALMAEKDRLDKENKKAEAAKLAEKKRQNKEARLADERRLQEARQAEQKKIEQENLAKQKRKEQTKLAEQKKQEQEAKIAEEIRKENEAKLTEQMQKEEEFKIARQKEQEAKLPKQQRKQEEAKIVEQKRREEKARLAEHKRKEEEVKLADQKKIAEARIAEQQKEDPKLVEQKKEEDQTKLVKEMKRKEEASLAEQRLKQQAKLAEQNGNERNEKLAEEQIKEETMLAKQKKEAEEAKLTEQRRKEEAVLAKQNEREQSRLAEQKKKDEVARLEQKKRKEVEARLAEEKRKYEQRVAQERLQAKKQELEENAKRDAAIKEAKLRSEKLAQQRREEQEKVQADFRREQLERISKVKFVNEEKKLDDERRAGEIGKAQAEIEAYSAKQASGNTEGVENPDVHLALVACGDRLDESMILLKSARLLSRVHLHFHVFAEEELKPKFKEQLAAWPEKVKKQTTFNVRSLSFPPENAEEWKKLFKTCASQRLFLPDLLPKLDSVLYLDTDILFMRPPEDIWRFFFRFNSSQIAALAPEHEDANIGWYNRFARHPYYPPLGVNSGVMLMNLTRMRSVKWVQAMIPYYKEYKYRITWGDQDLINIYFHFRPEMLYIYPCHWNFRPDHCMYMSICEPANLAGANIVHGSRRVWFNDKQPAFKAIYDAFKEYKFEDNLDEGLIRPIKASIAAVAVQNTNCGKNYQVLTKQLETQARLAKANKKSQKRAHRKETSKDTKPGKKGPGTR